jgi:hypothetical protein
MSISLKALNELVQWRRENPPTDQEREAMRQRLKGHDKAFEQKLRDMEPSPELLNLKPSRYVH